MTPVAPARNDESREALNENRSSIGGPTDGSGLTPEQVPAVIADMQQQIQTQQIAAKATALMPELIGHLEKLVTIPSVAFPGYSPKPVLEMAEQALAMFRDVGFTNAQLMDVPSGYPPIYGEIPGPKGSPVVILYGHYDVQPAPPAQGWTTDPWTPRGQPDGRIYGRGAADDKGGLAIHLGTMRIFEGEPPCTIRLIVEGMEETESKSRSLRRHASRPVRL